MPRLTFDVILQLKLRAAVTLFLASFAAHSYTHGFPRPLRDQYSFTTRGS
jgi:hypothetical protein